MSHKVIEEACIGCGGCEYACPRGALHKTESFLGLFVINPLTCDDCGECVAKCPTAAIVPDPDWAECNSDGCPLGSKRLADIECSVWQERCHECGTALWRNDGGEWECPRCGMGKKVMCPRTRRLDEIKQNYPEVISSTI